MPEKTWEGDHRCYKKALHPKHYAEVLANERNSLEKQQQMKRNKNNKKILRTVEERVGMISVWLCGEREEDDVDIEDWVACEMCSQWIHSKCIPSNHPYSISHADFHCHTVAILLNINCDAKGWGQGLAS